MKQLIDKSALAAEIEKRIADNKKDIERASHKNLEDYFEGYEDALVLLKQQYIDTLETKEVDLEKEIFNYLDNHNLSIQDGGRIVFNNGDTPNLLCDFRDITKFFFELGLKTKGE